MTPKVGVQMCGGFCGRSVSSTGGGQDGPPPAHISAALAPYVVSFSGYDRVLARAVAHRGLPSTAVVVVFALEQPLEVGWWDSPGASSSYFAVASGLHVRPAAVGGPNRQRGIWLALTPAGSRALLGVPAAALAGQILDLSAVAPHLSELHGRLAETACWPERLWLVEHMLLASLRGGLGGTVRPDVAAAIPHLTGTATVQSVADRVGWSRRHLSTAFAAELGVTPKEYQRIARFEASRRKLTISTQHERLSLAGIAAASGYADQAHLTREWAAFAGCPPMAWLRTEEVPAASQASGASAGQPCPKVQDSPRTGRPESCL